MAVKTCTCESEEVIQALRSLLECWTGLLRTAGGPACFSQRHSSASSRGLGQVHMFKQR